MNEKVKYQNLLNNLNNVANYILNSINELKNASSHVQKAITIDNNCYKKKEIETLINELQKQYNYLSNIYIPEVKKKIMEAS